MVRTHRRACAEPARLDFDDPSFVRNHLGRCLRPILLPFVAIFCRMILQQVKVMMNDDLFGSNTLSLSLFLHESKAGFARASSGVSPLRFELKRLKKGERGESLRACIWGATICRRLEVRTRASKSKVTDGGLVVVVGSSEVSQLYFSIFPFLHDEDQVSSNWIRLDHAEVDNNST